MMKLNGLKFSLHIHKFWNILIGLVCKIIRAGYILILEFFILIFINILICVSILTQFIWKIIKYVDEFEYTNIMIALLHLLSY